MRKILLIFAFALPLSAAAQENQLDEMVKLEPGLVITIKESGVEKKFIVDPMRTTSVTPKGDTLFRLDLGNIYFLPVLKTTQGDVPDGVKAILGRDAFGKRVLTMYNKPSAFSETGFILVSVPYKPRWMPLTSRRDITDNMPPLDELLSGGAVSFDGARGKYYYLPEDKVKQACIKSDVFTDHDGRGWNFPTAKDGEIEHLTTLDFLKKVADIRNGEEWKFLGDKPCVLDFWAEWCAPCKRMNPGVEALAKEYAGLVRVYKINIDEEPELKEYFKAVAIPMFVFIPRVGAPKAVMGSSIEVVHAEMEALLRPKTE